MSLDTLLSSLNSRQREAATMQDQHALVLAGAGTGKTKTIVARAAYLINQGVPAHRIQILTFTRRAASEIVARVSSHLGQQAESLHASTFHSWCMGLIRHAPKVFGTKGFSMITGDDQLMIFKMLRGRSSEKDRDLPTAAELCSIYSYARNTNRNLTQTLKRNWPEYLEVKADIVPILKNYEKKKQACHYLDYDDILSLVADGMEQSPEIRRWIGKQYDHLLVDEMQDTNPLQWSLLSPLQEDCFLFCVGDDAQSIYGFRGADFKNIHSFSERVSDSVVLKLTKNYRSTQEILDVSNWLLAQSPIPYNKKLVAARGHGTRPQMHDFGDEWSESEWITTNIRQRRAEGDNWRDHMILARTSFSARAIESCLIATDIPYRFIGGVKLLESAHVSDLLSLLRVVGNPRDEIALMRFLKLFPGVGDVTATRATDRLLREETLDSAINALRTESKIPTTAVAALTKVSRYRENVSKAITVAMRALERVLEQKYRNQAWPKRQHDFTLIAKLAEKHTSILGFIEEYLLDPIHASLVSRNENDDVVTIITIHSGKGTECKTCYVINASPGAFPSCKAAGDIDEVEEERRVLYVALTRAMDNLIVTRQSSAKWTYTPREKDKATESYFFNDLPAGLFESFAHNRATPTRTQPDARPQKIVRREMNYD